MKKVLFLITFLLLVTNIYGQAQKPRPKTAAAKATTKTTTKQMATTDDGKQVELSSNGTWRYADASAAVSAKSSTSETPASTKNSILSLEAGLVFKSGDIKPVARTEFHLLDKSLAEILREAGVQPSSGQDNSDRSIIFAYGLAAKYGNDSKFPAGVQEAIKKHVVQSATSDFTGKAKFSAAPQGSYFVFGFATTPKGFVIWNVKVELNSTESSVTLDQNNAEVAI